MGVICGDDLEHLPSPELVELAKRHTSKDYLRGPHSFHPGVLLAVAEEFPAVNMHQGTWWVICQKGEFKLSAD